jgi:hypothetical protein
MKENVGERRGESTLKEGVVFANTLTDPIELILTAFI